MSIAREEFEALWATMHRECDKIGMAVISGHTGRYEGCEYPMIGGATVIGIGSGESYVAPTMARPGDQVLITKGAAIEAAGLFAVTFPEKIAATFGEDFARQAEEIFWQMSVVDDALTAVEVGLHDHGVTAMHDATECGVWGGLVEVAHASQVGIVVHQQQVIVQDAVQKICDLFEIDPYSSISEGTLILTCRPHKAKEVCDRLGDRGIGCSVVGEILDEGAGLTCYEGGVARPLRHPQVDPFWAAFGTAAEGAAQ